MKANESVWASEMFVDRSPCDLRARLAVMSECALFDRLDQQERKALALSATSHAYAPDEALFLQGQEIGDIILIDSGAIKLSQYSPKGDSIILRMCARGDTPIIPLQGPKSRHTFAAHAVGWCCVMRWEVHLIQLAMARLPAMRGNVDSLVSQQMREMEERFWELLTETGRSRLARTIMRLAETIGRKEPEGILIPISTDDLAKMTGMTLFTTSRYIAAWRGTGFILGRRREALVVRDADELLAKCADTYGEP